MHKFFHKLLQLLKVDVVVTAMTFALLWLFGIVLVNVSFLNPVEQALDGFNSSDIYYAIQNESEAEESGLITVVDITEVHRRDSIAMVLEEVSKQNPAVIGVDIVFERPYMDDADDQLMNVADEVKDNTVFAFKLMDFDSDKQEYTRLVRSFFSFDGEAGLNEGFVNVTRETIREIPLWMTVGGKPYPSIVNKIASMYSNKPCKYDGADFHTIAYPPTHFNVVPWDQVAQNKDLIANRIVLVGGAHEAIDLVHTPVGPMYGVFVMAYGVQTLLTEDNMTHINDLSMLHILVTVLIIFLTCFVRHFYTFVFSFIQKSLPRLHQLMFTGFVETVITSVWMIIVVLCGFNIFYYLNVNIELKFALEGIFIVSIARDIYKIFIKKSDVADNRKKTKSHK